MVSVEQSTALHTKERNQSKQKSVMLCIEQILMENIMSRASQQSYLAQQKHRWSFSWNKPNAIISIFLATIHKMRLNLTTVLTGSQPAKSLSFFAPVHALYGFCA